MEQVLKIAALEAEVAAYRELTGAFVQAEVARRVAEAGATKKSRAQKLALVRTQVDELGHAVSSGTLATGGYFLELKRIAKANADLGLRWDLKDERGVVLPGCSTPSFDQARDNWRSVRRTTFTVLAVSVSTEEE